MNSPRRIIIFLSLVLCISLGSFRLSSANEVNPSAAKIDFGIIAGEWLRTDGAYTIKVSEVQIDGQATVEYFNPRPIHVASASISTPKELTRLFIKLQDKGYEGSTYTLFYYAEKDALAGFYYQAVTDRTYKVVFLRNSK